MSTKKVFRLPGIQTIKTMSTEFDLDAFERETIGSDGFNENEEVKVVEEGNDFDFDDHGFTEVNIEDNEFPTVDDDAPLLDTEAVTAARQQDSCGSGGCGSGGCSVPSEIELKYIEAQKAEEERLNAELEVMKADNTLTGMIFRQDFAMMNYHLNRDMHPDQLDATNEHYAIHHAAYQQQEDVVAMFIGKGATIDIRNCRGETALMWACKKSNTNITRMLIKAGADVNAVDDVGLTPLLHAAARGEHETMALLIHGYGVDVNQVDLYNKSPLHWAAYGGHDRAVIWLLQQGADRTIKDDSGNYPLHWASAQAHEAVCLTLLTYLAETHFGTDNPLITPYEHKDNIHYLTYHQLDDRNNSGCTPLEFAQQKSQSLGDSDDIYSLKYSQHIRTMQTYYYYLKVNYYTRGLIYGAQNLVYRLGGPMSTWFLTMLVAGMYSYINFLEIFLFDKPLVRIIFYVSYFLTLYCWFIVVYSEPNTVDPHSLVEISQIVANPQANSNSQFEDDLESGDTSLVSDDDIEAMGYTLRKMYKDILVGNKAPIPALAEEQINICTTCAIARPIRSKHCSICNRCVNRFDHHCPFFGTDVAAGNYRYFLFYLVSILICIGFFMGIFTYTIFKSRVPISYLFKAMPFTFFFHYHYIIYFLFAGGLFAQHVYLLITGSTTNESMNYRKYSYMKDSAGNFKNSYDLGCINNYKAQFCFLAPEPLVMLSSQINKAVDLMKNNYYICGFVSDEDCITSRVLKNTNPRLSRMRSQTGYASVPAMEGTQLRGGVIDHGRTISYDDADAFAV